MNDEPKDLRVALPIMAQRYRKMIADALRNGAFSSPTDIVAANTIAEIMENTAYDIAVVSASCIETRIDISNAGQYSKVN